MQTGLIYTILSGDGALTAALNTYEGAPAVFSDAAPDDYIQVAAPCVVIRAPSLDRADDTFSDSGRYVEQRVHLYALRSLSSVVIDAAATRVRELFQNQEAALGVAISSAHGPVEAPTTDEAVSGRQITIRINT